MKKLMIVLGSLLIFFSCKAREESAIYKDAKVDPKGSFKLDGCIGPDTFIKLAQKVGAAVVNVNTSKTIKARDMNPFGFFGNPRGRGGAPNDDFMQKFFGSPKQDRVLKQQSLGSGFIISKDGYIITNNHVVEQADEISVTLADDLSDFKAKVIGRDPKTDIALVKIESKKDLSVVELGDSDLLRVGEVVVAIGNPFGLSHTVTQGIVSAKERSIGMGNYDSFIQTDASINRGNSGGPLLNIDGQVVGINTAIVEGGQGIGFSIPINIAKNVITQLKEKGNVSRAWIGVYVQKITEELAKSFKLPDKSGALVSKVVENSPAEKAGLKNGDVIASFDGKEIKEYNELPLIVSTRPIGKKCDVEIIRNGVKKKVTLTLEELKDEQEVQTAQSETNPLGLTVENLTSDKAKNLGLAENEKGVVITAVDENSPARETQIQPGDLITEINKKIIININDYSKITSNLKKGDQVTLYLKRGREGTLYVAFTL